MAQQLVSLSKSSLVQLMEKAWDNPTLKHEFLGKVKTVIGREMGEIIPDFIHLKVLEETPDLLMIIVPPKYVPGSDDGLKENELKSRQARIEAVQTAIREGQLGLTQILRAVIQAELVRRAHADDGFMQELLSNSRSVVEQLIAEKGLPIATLPADLKVIALEETDTRRYMLLPTDPRSVTWKGLLEQAVMAGGRAKANLKPEEMAPGKGSDSYWQVANSNAWGYSLAKHGISLPLVGVFAEMVVSSDQPSPSQNVTICSFPNHAGTGRLQVEMPL